MAKNKNKPTKETVEMEKSEEVLTVVDSKKAKKAEKADKSAQNSKADKKVSKQGKKKSKNDKPKRNFGKEVVSELKKVNWPTFAKVCKQTGAVLVVVGVFMLATLGIDTLVSWILKLITKI